MDSSLIKAKYEIILDEIEKSRRKSRFSASRVNLVVVTKAQPVNIIEAAYHAGARMFGENYPEETKEKIKSLGELPGVTWHMIGHLQGRKAGIVAESFHMMHSIDRLEIAEKLNQRLTLVNRFLPVLLEVNASGEESKHGFPAKTPKNWKELVKEFELIAQLPNLKIEGLMTMPPLQEDCEKSRPYFVQIRELQGYLRKSMPQVCWDELSMGTSSDYKIAVEEGATFVRIGTAIVGERP